jgi:hypothetical protein
VAGRFYFGDEDKPDGSPANADWNDTARATARRGAISRKDKGDRCLKFGADGEPLLQQT